MSRGKLDKETAASVEKELPTVIDVRTASRDIRNGSLHAQRQAAESGVVEDSDFRYNPTK